MADRAAIMVRGLFIDGFAGGGGASTGIEQAIGRSVDIAVNHSPTAIAIHKANHPSTTHFCQDIKAVWPLAATRMQPVSGAWFSPDCKEFSKAKGGPVKDRSIRALCWEVVAWLKDVRPTCGYLENVEEFEYAAPLDDHGMPIRGQEGREFKRFIRAIRALGYRVAHRILRACDFGAPTSRKRLYMIMRCDGKAIVWPKPTHAAPGSKAVLAGKLQPYRTAAECIDWSLRCPSIFDRKRELADATKRRIAHGVMRYVINAAEPFIVGRAFTNTRASRIFDLQDPLRTTTTQPEFGVVDVEVAPFVTYGQHGGHSRPADEPHHTIAASKKDTNGLAEVVLAPHVTKFRTGSIGSSCQLPLPTVTANGAPARPAGATPLGVVTAFLSHFYTSNVRGGEGSPLKPHKTVTATGQHHAIVTAHIEQANGGPRNRNSAGRDARRPLSTATTTGSQQRVVETTMIEADALPPELMDRAVNVAAFLVKYYATDGENEAAQAQPVSRPLDTITTKARFAVVTVTIDARTYIIVDIGLRMLTPRELANAQGFPPDYVLNPVVRKFLRGKWVERPLTIAEQISAIGNSVCPPVARALIGANQPCERGITPERIAA